MRLYARTWTGKIPGQGTPTWTVVETDESGNNEYLFVSWLIQVIQLVLGESPFYADWGIPAIQSVIQQIFPDFYINVTQQKFQSYFASLIISKVPNTKQPTYTVNIMLTNGTAFNATIAL